MRTHIHPHRRTALVAAVLLIALAGFAGAAPTAMASSSQASIMMDDDQLLYRGDAVRDQTLRRMKQLGVDSVRVTVLWSVVAENAKKGSRRRRFKPDNPATYPILNWDRYDRLVRSAVANGLVVYFNVTGPGPDWAHAKAPKRYRKYQKSWMPKPREFYRYVAALAKRYNGSYRDENDGNVVLPRVSFWSLWNEPNQGGWLAPQTLRDKTVRKNVPQAPIMYRELYFFGRKALTDWGHDKDIILIGETAPLGQKVGKTRTPLRPKLFVRELLCLDSAGKPYTGKAAKARKCELFNRFGPLRATGYAHHPYTKTLAPTTRDTNSDSVTMANIGELAGLLDFTAAASGGRISTGLPVYLTEYGYETNPPDPFAGVSLANQAEYINIGDFLAYRDPRIAAQTQFLLRDVLPQSKRGGRRLSPRTKPYWFTYQSGLYTADGKPKPSVGAYTLPIVVSKTGQADIAGRPLVSIWGQLRFGQNGAETEVYIQHKGVGSTLWQTVGNVEPVTHPLGFFVTTRPAPGNGSWRALWVSESPPASVASREAPLTL